MTKFVYDQDETISTFVAKLVSGHELNYGRYKTIGVVDDNGRFMGGVVFYNWNPDAGTIEMTAASLNPAWLSRRALNRIGDFVFQECGCQMLKVEVPDDRERVLRVLAGAGFTFTRVSRLFGRAQDGVICTLTDDDWYSGRIARGRAAIEEAA